MQWKEARAFRSENEVHGPQVIDNSLELNRTTWQSTPELPRYADSGSSTKVDIAK